MLPTNDRKFNNNTHLRRLPAPLITTVLSTAIKNVERRSMSHHLLASWQRSRRTEDRRPWRCTLVRVRRTTCTCRVRRARIAATRRHHHHHHQLQKLRRWRRDRAWSSCSACSRRSSRSVDRCDAATEDSVQHCYHALDAVNSTFMSPGCKAGQCKHVEIQVRKPVPKFSVCITISADPHARMDRLVKLTKSHSYNTMTLQDGHGNHQRWNEVTVTGCMTTTIAAGNKNYLCVI